VFHWPSCRSRGKTIDSGGLEDAELAELWFEMELKELLFEEMVLKELLDASGSSLIAFALLLLRALETLLTSSGAFGFVEALAAMVLFRQSALLNAACERIARRRWPF